MRSLALTVAAALTLLPTLPATSGPLPCVAVPSLNDRCPAWTRIDAESTAFPADMVAGQSLVYSTTQAGDFGNAHTLTFATNAATGAPAWRATLAGSAADRNDAPDALALSPDGTLLVVTGVENIDPADGSAILSTGDLVVAAYDAATGVQRWVARRPGGMGHDVAFTQDGATVLVAGRVAGQGGTHDLAVLALDAVTGEERWARLIDGPHGGTDRAYGVTTAGERVIATGELRGDGPDERDFDEATIAFDLEDGEELWRHVADTGTETYSWETGQSLVASPDGGTVYVGARSGYQSNTTLTALDAATGGQRWRRILPPWGFDSDLVIDPAGDRLFLTGFDASDGLFGLDRTYAFNASTGTTAWTATFETETNTNYAPVAYDMAIRSNGRELFVGGVQRKQTAMMAWDYVTVSLDAETGERNWLAAYQTGYGVVFDDMNIARLIALRPDDSTVYTSGVVWKMQRVTGEPEGIGLVAYSTA